MKLFVGLGNPGSEHARQRHNVGFMAVERIAERHGLGPWKKRFHGLVCEGPIGGRRVMLLKPQTYMNDSGRSVGEAQRYLKIAEGDIYVFHDELDLAPGKLKVKTGGGNAGHNGLRSHQRAHRQRVCPRAHRHRPSRLQGPGVPLRAARLRQGRRGLARAAARRHRRCGAAPGGRRRRPLPDRRGARAEGGRGAAQGRRSPARARDARAARARARHPAGERQSKRMSALAENLKRWLKGRGRES